MISTLNDDCLIHIFNHLFDFEDLVNCFNVCIHWEELVKSRLSRVKYATIINTYDYQCLPILENQSSTEIYWNSIYIYINHSERKNLLQYLGSYFLPKLRIIDLQSMIIDENFSKSIVFSEFSKFLSTSKTIKGLIEPFYYESNFSKFCPNIEMLVTCRLELTNIDPVNGPKLKQLRLFGYHSIFWENISNLINLESLYISFVNFDHLKHFKSVRIGFPNLITLIHTYWDDKNYVAFNLIDNCPKLRSVYLFYTRSGLIEINDQIENLSIKDFVFEFAVKSYSLNWNWNLFNLILTKYRNIEHLAIRGNNQLADLHVPLIVQLLPNLVLLDMRDSPLITSSSKQFIDSFNLLTKRSISFLFGQNKHFDFDPNNLNLIDIGPDFMRTHFFKHISQLPYLIDQ